MYKQMWQGTVSFFNKFIVKNALFFALCAMFMPHSAYASLIDAFDLSPFVPMVLDAFMFVSTSTYDFFVGDGDGMIYVMVWGFLAVSLALGLVKMFFPKQWVEFFGYSGGGEMWTGKITGTSIVQDKILKPGLRAIIAAAVLLPIQPKFITQWLIEPFLQFGALYTEQIVKTMNTGVTNIKTDPESGETLSEKCTAIVEKAWISQEGCEFLVTPIYYISHANNQVIKQGIRILSNGLRDLAVLVPHGGGGFVGVITGIILISTFAASNLFMALLIIQALFQFGMSLILYPFNVLVWVAKPKNDKWFDVWPAFENIIKAMQQIIITSIACAFMLCINVALIRVITGVIHGSSVYMAAAGGFAHSNLPQRGQVADFNTMSLTWLTAILTLYLMMRIFEITREQLKSYVGGGGDELYKQVVSDGKRTWQGVTQDIPNKVKGWKDTWSNIKGTAKKITKK